MNPNKHLKILLNSEIYQQLNLINIKITKLKNQDKNQLKPTQHYLKFVMIRSWITLLLPGKSKISSRQAQQAKDRRLKTLEQLR